MHTKAPRINRFSQVVRFLRVSRLLLWTIWVMYRERRRVMHAHALGNYAVQQSSNELIEVLIDFRNTAENLGALMIKLGQFLSSRVDLLPEQAIVILSSLQDDVPPASFEHVVYVIESELGKPVNKVFSVLEPTCTAAASLSQVHKAVLASTGDVVAVKIQRPNSDQLIRIDLTALKFVIWVITSVVNTDNFIDLRGIFYEFQRIAYEEIDYVREAANAQRFREMFKDDATVYIPRVYDEYLSQRLLVLEWIDGMKINDYAALDAAGISRLEVVKRTVCAYFYQFFVAGFFHADPHPGNIFVKQGSEGKGPIITFVDFGMVGSHTKMIKKSLKDVFLAFIVRDARSLVSALATLGFIGAGADLATFEHSVALMMDQYYDVTLDEISKVDLLEMAQSAIHLLYGQPFHIPAQFAFTGRAIGTLMGISTGLAPEFNFIETATPYARKFLGLDAAGIEQALYQLFIQVLDTGRILLSLPRSLEQVIAGIEKGQTEAKLVGNGRKRMYRNGRREKNDEMLETSSFATIFVFSASLAGGIFLAVDTHQLIASWFCFSLTGLITLRLFMKR
nr:AarF/UbiB family protein [Ktedonobacteraceae bacterium]